jgi:hypothetical protein
MFDAFGPGIIIVTRTDVANSTPINIGFAQEFSGDFSSSSKELYGQNQYPLDAARGQVKVSGKMKAAVISGLAWNTVFFGESMATGGIKWNPSEAGIVPASTPYQITVANGATFDQDLGVVDAATNIPLIKVASAPAAGQYSVGAAGVYTFNTRQTPNSRGTDLLHVDRDRYRPDADDQRIRISSASSPIFPARLLHVAQQQGDSCCGSTSARPRRSAWRASSKTIGMPELRFLGSSRINAGQVGKFVYPRGFLMFELSAG